MQYEGERSCGGFGSPVGEPDYLSLPASESWQKIWRALSAASYFPSTSHHVIRSNNLILLTRRKSIL